MPNSPHVVSVARNNSGMRTVAREHDELVVGRDGVRLDLGGRCDDLVLRLEVAPLLVEKVAERARRCEQT